MKGFRGLFKGDLYGVFPLTSAFILLGIFILSGLSTSGKYFYSGLNARVMWIYILGGNIEGISFIAIAAWIAPAIILMVGMGKHMEEELYRRCRNTITRAGSVQAWWTSKVATAAIISLCASFIAILGLSLATVIRGMDGNEEIYWAFDDSLIKMQPMFHGKLSEAVSTLFLLTFLRFFVTLMLQITLCLHIKTPSLVVCVVLLAYMFGYFSPGQGHWFPWSAVMRYTWYPNMNIWWVILVCTIAAGVMFITGSFSVRSRKFIL